MTDKPQPLIIDGLARRVLMASWLYYRHDISVISDDEFDRSCQRLAFRWLALSPFLQWQLGSAHEIATSGYHCKITAPTEGGAIYWAWKALDISVPRVAQWDWRQDEIEGRLVRWTEAGASK